MNKKIILSIIVPVYNVELYIDECVNCLLNQGLNHDEYEIILVNDGSTDSTKNICELFVKNYLNVKLINQSNLGLSAARNTGVQVSSGEFIYFIDSDDLLKEGVLSKIIHLMVSEKLDFFGFQPFRTRIRDTSKLREKKFDIVFEGNGIKILEEYNFNNGVWWYVFNRISLKKIKFKEGRFCEDGIFTSELLLNINNAIIVNNQYYLYYDNVNSIVNNKNNNKNHKIVNDMFYVVCYFDIIINSLPSDNIMAYQNLRMRQETYLYYGIIRYIKLNNSSKELLNKIKALKFNNYNVYPIEVFKGYDKRDQILIFIINNIRLLKLLNLFNKFIKVIK